MDLIMDQHQISTPNILNIIHSTATVRIAAHLSMANTFHDMAILNLMAMLSMPRMIRMGRIWYFPCSIS